MENYKLFQLGVSYAQSLLTYSVGDTPRPFSAAFSVTNRCNLKCVYCNCPNLETPELSLNEIEFLFKKLKRMGVVRMGFLGGEPLVRKDFGDIVMMAKKMGFFISVNTNLLLYRRYKEALEPVDYFFTSLDGTPEKHMANRGRQNYETILEAIRDIVSQKKKITAICVVTDPDITSADYLIDLAVRENIDVHFQQECYNVKFAGRNTPENMQQQATRDFWQYLMARKKAGAPITSSKGYLDYISKWEDYGYTAMYDANKRCAAGRGFLFVDPTGIAYPCPFVQGHVDVEGVDLMKYEWADKFNPKTPCTKCIVGAMLEFNLLYQKPLTSVAAALSKT